MVVVLVRASPICRRGLTEDGGGLRESLPPIVSLDTPSCTFDPPRLADTESRSEGENRGEAGGSNGDAAGGEEGGALPEVPPSSAA